jgi:hypothetical protein
MYFFGVVILVCIGLYYLFMAVDRLDLANQKSPTKVVDKGYGNAGRTYYTLIIGGRLRVMSQTIPEMYVLKRDSSGRETEAAVAKSLYKVMNIQEPVQVTYKQARITGV